MRPDLCCDVRVDTLLQPDPPPFFAADDELLAHERVVLPHDARLERQSMAAEQGDGDRLDVLARGRDDIDEPADGRLM